MGRAIAKKRFERYRKMKSSDTDEDDDSMEPDSQECLIKSIL
jgi:hypothetical protein